MSESVALRVEARDPSTGNARLDDDDASRFCGDK